MGNFNCMFKSKLSNSMAADMKKIKVPTMEAKSQLQVEASNSELTCSSSKKQRSDIKKAGRGKNVRLSFKVGEEKGDDGAKPKGDKGAVRIRIVVTQEELSQILSNKYSSVEQFLRSRSKSKYVERCKVSSGNWRPALESIPEDF